jgi:O-antigen/teichoic acid export membrane protein
VSVSVNAPVHDVAPSAVHDSATRPAAARRERRAVATTGSTVVAHVVTLASTAALVPMTLGYLGAERYGVWMAMLAVVTVLSLSDGGVGNAIVSRIAAAVARGDEDDVAADVSTACGVAIAIAGVVGAALAVALAFAPVADIFNVPSGGTIDAEVRRAAAVLVAATLARIPLDLSTSIRRGYQEGYVTGAFAIAGAVGKVVFVAIAIAMDTGIVGIVVAVCLGPLLMSLANWLMLLRQRPHLRPRRALVTGTRTRALVRGGGLFLALQIAVVVGFSSDNLVGAHVLGPAAVTTYAVPSQLAFAVIGLLALLAMPLWPAYADAAARDDWAWIRRTFGRSLTVVFGSSLLAGAALVALGRPIVERWSNGDVVPSWSLLSGFAAWIVLSSLGTTVSALLNALHVVREQVVCALGMAALNIVLSVVLAREIGVSGLIWGTVISYGVCVSLPFAVLTPRVLRRQG